MRKLNFLKLPSIYKIVIFVLLGSVLFYSGIYASFKADGGGVDGNNSTRGLSGIVLSDFPIYKTLNGKLVSERVVSTNPIQVEQNIVESANLTNVGNVTNIQTWINTEVFENGKRNFVGDVGKGMIITASGEIATWEAHDSGTTNGTDIIFHGIIFFHTSSNGKLSFLNNLTGLYVTKLKGDKQITTIWQWK